MKKLDNLKKSLPSNARLNLLEKTRVKGGNNTGGTGTGGTGTGGGGDKDDDRPSGGNGWGGTGG